ncbi:hypothetical protein ABIA15_005963 [Sinorhizobium fredii]
MGMLWSPPCTTPTGAASRRGFAVAWDDVDLQQIQAEGIAGIVIENGRVQPGLLKPISCKRALSGLQVVRRHFAGLAILHQLICDLLAVVEAAHSRPFHRRNVNEDVGAAVVRLDETKTPSLR